MQIAVRRSLPLLVLLSLFALALGTGGCQAKAPLAAATVDPEDQSEDATDSPSVDSTPTPVPVVTPVTGATPGGPSLPGVWALDPAYGTGSSRTISFLNSGSYFGAVDPFPVPQGGVWQVIGTQRLWVGDGPPASARNGAEVPIHLADHQLVVEAFSPVATPSGIVGTWTMTKHEISSGVSVDVSQSLVFATGGTAQFTDAGVLANGTWSQVASGTYRVSLPVGNAVSATRYFQLSSGLLAREDTVYKR